MILAKLSLWQTNTYKMTNQNPVIGVLTDRYIQYQASIAENLAVEINAAGYGMLCVVAKELQPPFGGHSAHSVCNSIYSQINHFGIDGVIALSGTLGYRVDAQTLSDFLHNFNIPTVSFGMNIQNMPSVYFDENIGMSKLMHHLLTDNTRKNFAFVRGHQNDSYSIKRENIFRESLLSTGIALENIQYLEGDYDAYTTYKVVYEQLNKSHNLDCIVAANDVMAASAARAAKAHGLSIPNDISICGFDDSVDATRHSPALTTVRQPIGKMAKESVALLIKRIKHSKIRSAHPTEISSNSIKSELIIRRSTNFTTADSELVGALSKQKLREMLNVAMSGLSTPKPISIQQISELLWETLEYGTMELSGLADQLDNNLVLKNSHWWQNLCEQIDSLSDMFVASGYRAERIALVSLAVSKVKERIWSLEMDRKFEASRLQNVRSDMQIAMSSCTNIESIISAMNEWLTHLNPERCFLVRYEHPGAKPNSTAQLLHMFKNGESVRPPSDLFHANSILPAELLNELSCGLLVLSPIHADDILFGYLLFDPSNIDMLYIDAAAQCIGNAMRTHNHIEKLQTQKNSLESVNKKLSYVANFDSLTGLANRFQFQQYIEGKTEGINSHKEPFSLLFLDLDGFKLINDTLGHDAGDQLLVQVATLLRTCVNNFPDYNGFISRLGGDEFTVILHPTRRTANIQIITQQLLDQLSSEILLGENGPVNISASIGCALFPIDATNATTLMKNADLAMYHAKQTGKNNIAFYGTCRLLEKDDLMSGDAQGLNTVIPGKAA